MREVTGDLWTYPSDALVIPTNTTLRKSGDAVMGAGVAKQAAVRYPELPQRLGMSLRYAAGAAPEHFVMSADGRHIVAFPTKSDWRKPSSLSLIKLGLPVLVQMADYFGWQVVALPRLGCGRGGLEWEMQVRPLLADALDDRFVVVNHPQAERAGYPDA